ncbi:MAG: GNAT family N-acetyltransferase [Bacteroidetes bacterium]|nr:GNAT family N-acetyltransferase [Bacteroidota bacterium]
MQLPEFIFSEKVPETKKFLELFLTTGWNNSYKLSDKELEYAIHNSWYTYSAYDGDQLVGLGRLISDGIIHALIIDLIILPEYQSKGLGKKILEQLVLKCKTHQIRDIQLFSAKDKAGFYEKSGFTRRPEISPGMELKWFRKD